MTGPGPCPIDDGPHELADHKPRRTLHIVATVHSLTGRDTLKEGALVHYSDGTPYSRTGRNVRTLCGRTARPDHYGRRADLRVCQHCVQRLLPSDTLRDGGHS